MPTELVSRATVDVAAPAADVYARLLDARSWHAWRSPPLSGRLIGAVTQFCDKLTAGDRLGYLATPAICGILPLPTRATVTRAAKGVLEFEDDACFGLAAGTHTFKVVGKGKNNCVVTIEHATTGPLRVLDAPLAKFAKERAVARWALDLKRASERGK